MTTLQTLERKKQLTGLAPKRGLIPAEPIKGIGRQITEVNIGACEIRRWIWSSCERWRDGIKTASKRVLILPAVAFGRGGVAIYAVDDPLAFPMGLSLLSELQQVCRLNLEEAALDGGGAAQPP